MKMINIKKLAVLCSLALGGCASAEGLEKLVTNRILSDPSPTSVPSDYATLNPSNDLIKEQSETSSKLINSIIPVSYAPYSISPLYWDINVVGPVYLNEIRNKPDANNENGKNGFYIPEISLDFYGPTEPSDKDLTFKQEFDSDTEDRGYHKIEYMVADLLRNPNLDHLEKAVLGLSAGYIANLKLRPVINFKKKIQGRIGDLTSENLEKIGIEGVNAKVSTKGLQFTSGNKTFTLGKTIKFEYKGLNNHFTGTCKGEILGVLDEDYLFECRLRLWW